MSENIEILRPVTSAEKSRVVGKQWRGDFGPVVLFQGLSFTLVTFGPLVGIGALLAAMNIWLYLGGYQILPAGVHSSQLALALAFGAPVSAYIITRLLDMHSWLSGEKTFLEYLRTVSFGLWGGLLGGIAILTSFAFGTGTPILPLLDAFAVGVPLAQMFGRIGCLNYGCCHGKVCESKHLPAIQYHHKQTKVIRYDPELKGKRLHPTQIYSILANLMIYGLMILLWMNWESRPAGGLAGLYFLLYGAKRFSVEVLRGEFPRVYFKGLTVWQWFSVIFVVVGAFLLLYVGGGTTMEIEFNLDQAMHSLWGSFWVLGLASFILTLAYGLHGKKIGTWG